MEPLIGSVLDGRFGIDVYLGGGSMADVYRGLDLEQNIPVAVKVLRPAMTQSFELVERFRREAAALAQLSHPNIVQQHGAGRDGDYVYIAMQFVDGHPLSNELADAAGPMPLERVLSIADDVCAALSYAHEHGIVHRDIKPGNILIDTTGRAILTDFGIAKVADAASMTAFAIGTPAYMSPEQCRGQTVDGRTDIYAFACVLYEMLASVKPFRGEGTQYDEGSSHAIVHEQMTREAPALRLYNPKLNPETEDVIRTAMAKSAARRQADARQLSEQLHTAVGHRGLRALRVVAPPGADVLLDGEVAGSGTVIWAAVPDGDHVIEARAAGYEPYRSAIAIPETEVVFAGLVPLPQPEARVAAPVPMRQSQPGPSPVAAEGAPLLGPSAVSIHAATAATVAAKTTPPEAAAAPTAAQAPPSDELPPGPPAATRPHEGRENAPAVLPMAAPVLWAPAPAPPPGSGETPQAASRHTAAQSVRRSRLWYVVPALALTGLGAAAIAVGLLYFRGGHSAPAAAVVPSTATTRVDVSTSGTQANGLSELPFISRDGRLVAFDSDASNLVSNDTNNHKDVFVHDRQTKTTERASVSTEGAEANGDSRFPRISADGQIVVFTSLADNLVPGDTNGKSDVFVRDLREHVTTRVSVDSLGGQGNGDSEGGALSVDGRYVAFSSDSTNLEAGVRSGASNVYVRDLQGGGTRLVSTGIGGAEANGASSSVAISDDGRFITYVSEASNLVSGDTNAVADVFVYDQKTQDTNRVSVESGGGQWNRRSLPLLAISPDGRFVCFNALTSNDLRTGEVFVRDRQTGTTDLVSVNLNGAEASGPNDGCSISMDGRYIAFNSSASDLVPGDSNGVSDVLVRDRQEKTTERVSVDGRDVQGNGHSLVPVSMSGDGRYVAFPSLATNLIEGDTNQVQDIFVYDRGVGSLPVSIGSATSTLQARAGQPTAATSTRVVPATPMLATATPHAGSLPAQPYAAIVARLEAPPDCLKQRVDPGDSGTVIQCLVDGTPVRIEQGPRVTAGQPWWQVTAPDGRKGWMAEEYLLLSTRTILIGRSDTAGSISLSLDAVDIPPGGDLVLQLSFANHGSSSVGWTSDHVNDPTIYLSDSQNRHILSHAVGGDFSRDVPGGLPPNATFHGWQRFTLPDSSYRGPLTLHYPNHGDITFQFAP